MTELSGFVDPSNNTGFFIEFCTGHLAHKGEAKLCLAGPWNGLYDGNLAGQ